VTGPQQLDHTFSAPIQKSGSFPTYLVAGDSAELTGLLLAGNEGQDAADGEPNRIRFPSGSTWAPSSSP
jgi:hypothetical protein